MLEHIIEYLFSVMDYSYILFFYHQIRGKSIERVKFISSVFIISFIQFYTEFIQLFRFIASVKDIVLILLFLIIYDWKINAVKFIHAFIIDSIFFFTLTLSLTIFLFLSVDMNLALTFGLYRIIFTLILKVCMITLMYLCVSQLCRVKIHVEKENFLRISITFSICGLLFSYILQLSEGNSKLTFIMLLFELIAIFLMYIAIAYNQMVKNKYDLILYQQIINMSEKNIDRIVEEQKEVKKIIHDVKNQMLKIEDYIEKGKGELAQECIKEWLNMYSFSCPTPICLNVYVDYVLRQKMEEFPEIDFNFKIQIPEYLNMKPTDIISLLSNLIEQSCKLLEYNHKKNYRLELLGNDEELRIHESYPVCANKLKLDSFKIAYFKSTIDEYEGDVKQFHEKNIYHQSILLFFKNQEKLPE